MTSDTINKLNIHADAFNKVRNLLNECDRRHFLAKTAMQFGYGAISILSRRTGVAISTIRRGIAELTSQESPCGSRIRCAGAGRKPVEQLYPDIIEMTKEILEDETYGSPEGRKWTSCSLRKISNGIGSKRHLRGKEHGTANHKGPWL